jgi:hypothetical protein
MMDQERFSGLTVKITGSVKLLVTLDAERSAHWRQKMAGVMCCADINCVSMFLIIGRPAINKHVYSNKYLAK